MQAFTTLGVGIHGARDSLQAALLRFIAKEKIHGFASASGVVEASKQLHVHSAPPVRLHCCLHHQPHVRSEQPVHPSCPAL